MKRFSSHEADGAQRMVVGRFSERRQLLRAQMRFSWGSMPLRPGVRTHTRRSLSNSVTAPMQWHGGAVAQWLGVLCWSGAAVLTAPEGQW